MPGRGFGLLFKTLGENSVADCFTKVGRALSGVSADRGGVLDARKRVSSLIRLPPIKRRRDRNSREMSHSTSVRQRNFEKRRRVRSGFLKYLPRSFTSGSLMKREFARRFFGFASRDVGHHLRNSLRITVGSSGRSEI